METNRLDAAIIDIATMKADMRSMSESFKEFKEETKDFHERQTKQLDDMAKQWAEFGGVVKMVADMNNRMNNIESKKDDEHEKIRNEIKETYITKEEFAPVKAVVYGMVATILLSVLTAIIYLVVT